MMTNHKKAEHGHPARDEKDADRRKVTHTTVTLSGEKAPMKRKREESPSSDSAPRKRSSRSPQASNTSASLDSLNLPSTSTSLNREKKRKRDDSDSLSPELVPRKRSSRSPLVSSAPALSDFSDYLSTSAPPLPTFDTAASFPPPQSAMAADTSYQPLAALEDVNATTDFTYWNPDQDLFIPSDLILPSTTPAQESLMYDPYQTLESFTFMSSPETQPVEQSLLTNIEQPPLPDATDLQYGTFFYPSESAAGIYEPQISTSSNEDYGACSSSISADQTNGLLPDNECIWWEHMSNEKQLAFISEHPGSLQPSSLAPPPALSEEPQSVLDWDTFMASLGMPPEENDILGFFPVSSASDHPWEPLI